MGSNNSARLDDPVATALGSDTDSSRLGKQEDCLGAASFRRLPATRRTGALSQLLERYEFEEDDWPEGDNLKAS